MYSFRVNHEAIALSIGVFRLALVAPFAYLISIGTQTVWIPIAIVCGIALLDIIDGAYADWKGVSTPRRRLLDNIVDRVVVHACFLTVFYCYNISLFWYVPLMIRDVVVIGMGMSAVRQCRAVVFPHKVHKVVLLIQLVAGIAVVLQHPIAFQLLTLSYCVLYLATIDHVGLFLKLTHNQFPLEKPRALQAYRPAGLEGFRHFGHLAYSCYHRWLRPKVEAVN